MTAAIIQFVISSAVIVAAGIALARFADIIAERTGIGGLVVGGILLAGATSLPELTIDLNAIWLDEPDLAMGGVVGSSLFNLLILAFADLLHHRRGFLIGPSMVRHALSGLVTMIMTAIVGVAILAEQKLKAFEWLGIGPGSIALTLAYAAGIRIIVADQRKGTAEKSTVDQTRAQGLSLGLAVAGYVVATAVVFIIAPYLAQAADDIADESGIGTTFIGTTLVAFATSLPELVATLTALRIGALDLAIGNIFGSNAFNMLLLVVLDAAMPGSLFSSVSVTHVITCLTVVLTTAVVLLGQLYRVEKRILFLEPDATLVIALAFSSLALIYAMR